MLEMTFEPTTLKFKLCSSSCVVSGGGGGGGGGSR